MDYNTRTSLYNDVHFHSKYHFLERKSVSDYRSRHSSVHHVHNTWFLFDYQVDLEIWNYLNRLHQYQHDNCWVEVIMIATDILLERLHGLYIHFNKDVHTTTDRIITTICQYLSDPGSSSAWILLNHCPSQQATKIWSSLLSIVLQRWHILSPRFPQSLANKRQNFSLNMSSDIMIYLRTLAQTATSSLQRNFEIAWTRRWELNF